MKIRLKSGEELDASGVSFKGKLVEVSIGAEKKTIKLDDIDQIDWQTKGKEEQRWL